MKRGEAWTLSLLLLGAAALLVVGWRLLWFLTDDAFIAFRYVSNAHLGYGYVWNAPPFLPVEGYSSFLWVVLLDVVWRLTGVPPPAAANWIALGFSLLSLGLAAVLVLRVPWRPELRPWRWVFVALVLLGVTSNRTFLTWSSSGFETAMFACLLLAWITLCLQGPVATRRGGLALACLAAALHLARPEGLLFAAATLGILAVVARERGWRHIFVAALPLVVLPAHLVWRRWFYGDWLPNTYYAKVVGTWPESGVRYALSFVVEYALWLPLLVGVVAGASGARAPQAGRLEPPERKRSSVRALCVGAVAAHFLYYTFVVGGDHFEYRIYMHLIVPAYVLPLWLANRSRLRGGMVAALLAAQVALALPVPWSHWALSRQLLSRAETRRMRVAIAPHWPAPFRGYARLFDSLQDWLIAHWVCVRHQEHKVNQEYLESLYPSRAEGDKLAADGFPVLSFQAVGVAAWSLPRVNIIDLLGLNDWVIARAPVEPARFRGMAHEREAPPEYVQCFAPNVFLVPGGGVRIAARDEPLTAAGIRACESTWRQRLR